jgi:hypothetical protein
MGRRGRTVTLAVLALCAAGLVVHALQYPFITDDAYISFRYAYNLAYHGELSFNLGQRVEGYTNFLWTVTLGLLLKAGLRPDVMSRVLGAAFGVVVLVLLYALTRLYRGGRRTGWDLLGPAMLAASMVFAAWCSGGLETQMFSALTLAGVVLYLAEGAGRVRWRLSGLLFALSAMARPEGVMLFGLTGLHRLAANIFGQRRLLPTRAELLWVAGFVVPFGLFFAWRYSYYGWPFPNTYYIKAGGGATASITNWGIPYLWDFIKDSKLFVLPALLPLFWPRSTWRRDGVPPEAGRPGLRPLFVWSYVLLLALTYMAYVVAVGGDFMGGGRFFVPVLPLLMFWVQEALRETVERPRRAPDQWRPARMLICGALVLGLLVANSVHLYRVHHKLQARRWGWDTIAYLKKFADDRILIGTWIRHNLPRDTYLAVGGAGAIVYASRCKALDTFGLNDAWIAHNTPKVGDRPGHGKTAPESYLEREKPDLMCHQARHQDWPYRPDPGEQQMWRSRGYKWVCINPNGLPPYQRPPELPAGYKLRPSYYCCLKRLDRDLGPWPAERSDG